MKEIPITQNKIVLVDDEDYEKMIKYKWQSLRAWSTFYAVRIIKVKDKRTVLYMHRYIMELVHGDEQIVDHVNRNGLDNRKINLRLVTPALNNLNQKIRKDNSSGYRGVGGYRLR